MLVYFTEELSTEVEEKFRDVVLIETQAQIAFNERFYGKDLTTIYISLLCNSPKFAPFIKNRRPNYKSEQRAYMHRGISVTREERSLSYDLKLNYDLYACAKNVKRLLAFDILASLDVIN